MPTLDPTIASCSIFTFKEGLLSAVAHDLELRVARFEGEFSDDFSSLQLKFDAMSIRVEHAVVDGRPSPSTLSPRDRAKIEGNITKDVIDTRRHGEIRFDSEEIERVDSGWTIRGRLHLNGHTRPLVVDVRIEGDRAVAEGSLHQPDYGIRPYRAMMGTLRIQPTVRFRFEAPLPA